MARYGAAEMAPVPEPRDMEHLTFREELHALEAVVAGQGIGIFCDALIAPELSAGSLVKAFNLTLPGYRLHVVRRHDHPRETVRGCDALLVAEYGNHEFRFWDAVLVLSRAHHRTGRAQRVLQPSPLSENAPKTLRCEFDEGACLQRQQALAGIDQIDG